jgi:hypothetical protein
MTVPPARPPQANSRADDAPFPGSPLSNPQATFLEA